MNKTLLINILALFLVVVLASMAQVAKAQALSTDQATRPIVDRAQPSFFEEKKPVGVPTRATRPVLLPQATTQIEFSDSPERPSLDAREEEGRVRASQDTRTFFQQKQALEVKRAKKDALLTQKLVKANEQIAFKAQKLATRYAILGERMIQHLTLWEQGEGEQYERIHNTLSKKLVRLSDQQSILLAIIHDFSIQEDTNKEAIEQYITNLRLEGLLFKKDIADLQQSLLEAVVLLSREANRVDEGDDIANSYTP